MTIVIYCVFIVLASLIGGYLPLSKRLSHLRLQVYLSLSAGAMLGAAFFHMLPEAAELAGRNFGLWTAMGVIGLYLIERFLSPHSHAPSDEGALEAPHHHHGHVHAPDPAPGHAAHEVRSAAPRVAGWSAVAGLSIHTVLGGVALGSAVGGHDAAQGLGLAVFLATVLHKPADSLTISTLLLKSGVPKRLTLAVQAVFALLIPLGALLFFVGKSSLAAQVDSSFTGCVLAFSAGTFLCIALSDLLPEVQFHSHDRLRLFLAVVAGAALMWATALIEPGHGHSDDPAHPEKVERLSLPEPAGSARH